MSFFFFFFFWRRHAACRILVPWPGIEPMTPGAEACSLNHWMAREVPKDILEWTYLFVSCKCMGVKNTGWHPYLGECWVPRNLPTVAFAPSVQMSTQWRRQRMSSSWYENCFDLKGSWECLGFCDSLCESLYQRMNYIYGTAVCQRFS